jgi:hypothetical protein
MIRSSLFVLTFVFAAVGCGSSSGPGGGNGGNGGNGGGAADMAIPVVDLAPPPPDLTNAFMCGSTTCGPGQQCCVTNATPMCATSCPDGGFTAECKGPENCGGNPCCITIGNGFQVKSVACTQAASACPPMIMLQTQSGQDRACKVDADCTSGVAMPQLPDCCTNKMTMQHVCFNKTYLQIPQVAMGWTCP